MAQELSEAERVRVEAFGLDKPGDYAAEVAVAMIDADIARRWNPMNGDGSNYTLSQLRKRLVRRFPEAVALAAVAVDHPVEGLGGENTKTPVRGAQRTRGN